jgi:hypothetical protein
MLRGTCTQPGEQCFDRRKECGLGVALQVIHDRPAPAAVRELDADESAAVVMAASARAAEFRLDVRAPSTSSTPFDERREVPRCLSGDAPTMIRAGGRCALGGDGAHIAPGHTHPPTVSPQCGVESIHK